MAKTELPYATQFWNAAFHHWRTISRDADNIIFEVDAIVQQSTLDQLFQIVRIS